jgi:hypothetical protein
MFLDWPDILPYLEQLTRDDFDRLSFSNSSTGLQVDLQFKDGHWWLLKVSNLGPSSETCSPEASPTAAKQ